VLRANVRFGYVGRDARYLGSVLGAEFDVRLCGDARNNEDVEFAPGQYRRYCLQIVLVARLGKTILKRGATLTIAMSDLDGVNSGRVKGCGDGGHVIWRELVADGVHSVAQSGVDNSDACHTCVLNSLTAWSRSATFSPVAIAAAVIMSRFPAYFGRNAPSPSTSTMSVILSPSAIGSSRTR